MATITVWILVTIAGTNGIVTYSPPFASETECIRIRETIPHSVKSRFVSVNKCVKMEIVK